MFEKAGEGVDSILWNHEVDEILDGDTDVTGVRVRGVDLGLTSDSPIDGVLLLIIINHGLGTRGVSPFVYPVVACILIFIAIDLDSLKNRKRTGGGIWERSELRARC